MAKTYWLLEKRIGESPVWYRDESAYDRYRWTTVAGMARKFDSKHEAELFAESQADGWSVTEHMFY